MNTYTTRDEAIAAEIIAPIEATGEASAREEFYVDELADALIELDPETGLYSCPDRHNDFWQTVGDAAR